MRRAVVIILNIYIAVVSVLLALSVYQGAFRQLFENSVSWRIHTAVSVLLAAVGAVTVAGLFLKPSIVPMLQALWWLPQLIKVELWHFAADKSRAICQSLYHWPMGVTVAVHVGWARQPDDYLFVKLNLVALGGMILALILWRKQHLRPATPESDAAAASACSTE